MNGLLVIDKPPGMTSRDVVNVAQRWFPRRTKIGHTGTLDPLATGVLVLCIGEATKLAERIQALGKTYLSRFRLGAMSTTDDADGTITPRADAATPKEQEIQAALTDFVGEIDQIPPTFSAIKVAGRRAYDLARRGNAVELTSRKVRVDSIRLVAYDWPWADVEIACGKGTYVRSIARDLGDKLGVGGMVETLRRTRVGPFTAEMGIRIDASAEHAHQQLLPMNMVEPTRIDNERV